MEQVNTHNLYEIFKAKDKRFDGKIFVGIKTTGIYCRTVCTARVPKEENCIFFSSQAEAEANGYRPCLICRPELAPENTRLNASKTLATRAIKLLEENIENECAVKEVANTLEISDRHLRRIFKEEYNVTPIQYLQTCKLLLAKQLLTDTNLNMLDVAMASGFGSLRRFNDIFQKQYKITPSYFRQKDRKTKNRNNEITITIGYHPPCRYEEILNFLKKRMISGIEKISNNKYYRTISIKKKDGYVSGYIIIENNAKKNVINLTISDTLLKVLPQVIGKVKKLLDLSSDPYSIYESVKEINNIIPNSFLIGTRVVGSIDDFETCVRAVIGQLVSVKSATTFLKRITEELGTKIETNIEGLEYVFPVPENIYELGDNIQNILGELGITKVKSTAIKELAKSFVEEKIDFNNCSNSKNEIDKLVKIKGIGKWTAEYIAMRTMNDTDILLDTDYAVKKLMKEYDIQKSEVFDKFKPLRSYITFGIWNLLKEEL